MQQAPFSGKHLNTLILLLLPRKTVGTRTVILIPNKSVDKNPISYRFYLKNGDCVKNLSGFSIVIFCDNCMIKVYCLQYLWYNETIEINFPKNLFETAFSVDNIKEKLNYGKSSIEKRHFVYSHVLIFISFYKLRVMKPLIGLEPVYSGWCVTDIPARFPERSYLKLFYGGDFLKRLCIFLTLAVLLTFSGCELTPADITDLMCTPKLTEEQSSLQKALEKETVGGGKYTLKFPLSGRYRSAFILHDIDGDGQQEAIALYCPKNENGGTHVMILKKSVDTKQKDKDADTWKKIADISGDGNDVENIDFGNYDGSGVDYLTIGWTVFTSTNFTVGVYKVTSAGSTRLFSGSFTKMQVLDIDKDNKEDLLLLMLDPGAKISKARLISMADGHFKETANAPLDSTVSSYADIQVTRLTDKSFGVLIDGYKGANSMITELICWKNGRLVSPFYDETKGTVTSTLRNVAIKCTDIDNDSVVEIPIEVEMPGYENKPLQDKIWKVGWCVYNGGQGFSNKCTTAFNFSRNYYFIMPASWENTVTVQSTGENRVWTFREWDKATETAGRELFEVRVYTKQEWQKCPDKSSLLFKAYEQNDIVYAVKMGTRQGADDKLFLPLSEILKRLKLYNF